MPFSRLLLVAAHSRKYIIGNDPRDKVEIKPRLLTAKHPMSDPWNGEVVLCFQVDDKVLCSSLGIDYHAKRCDGLIFYARDGDPKRIICLVEMKSRNVDEAAKQIKGTYDKFKNILEDECALCPKNVSNIEWWAFFYRKNSPKDEVAAVAKELKSFNIFKGVISLDRDHNDIGPYIRGDIRI